jgi:1-deoxy-D-xylulose-5-phosphate synthase
MREGSGLVKFSQRFPERYYDVAIAEQHAVTLAAGFACKGMKPIVAIYSSFLQRAYDQVIHDVGIQNLAIVFAIDRAGLVGADGATHSGNYDISFLRCIPNFTVMVPADENECRQMLYTAYLCNSPVAVRYPRGKGIGITPDSTLQAIEIGKAQLLRQVSPVTKKATTIAILLFGSLLTTARSVAEQLNTSLVNMRFVKPLDQHCIRDIANSHQLIVTLEDNAIMGGAGSAVNEYLHAIGNTTSVLNLGLPDHYIHHAEREQQLADCGLSVAAIIEAINQFEAKLTA